MPTDEELDAMGVKLYGEPWKNGKLAQYHGDTAKAVVMQLAIAAKQAKAMADLAEYADAWMCRYVHGR